MFADEKDSGGNAQDGDGKIKNFKRSREGRSQYDLGEAYHEDHHDDFKHLGFKFIQGCDVEDIVSAVTMGLIQARDEQLIYPEAEEQEDNADEIKIDRAYNVDQYLFRSLCMVFQVPKYGNGMVNFKASHDEESQSPDCAEDDHKNSA